MESSSKNFAAEELRCHCPKCNRQVPNLVQQKSLDLLQQLRDNSVAIEKMTAELLEIEVITGERVREIITECGGKVFVDEDLHSDAIVNSEVEEVIIEEKLSNTDETTENK